MGLCSCSHNTYRVASNLHYFRSPKSDLKAKLSKTAPVRTSSRTKNRWMIISQWVSYILFSSLAIFDVKLEWKTKRFLLNGVFCVLGWCYNLYRDFIISLYLIDSGHQNQNQWWNPPKVRLHISLQGKESNGRLCRGWIYFII